MLEPSRQSQDVEPRKRTEDRAYLLEVRQIRERQERMCMTEGTPWCAGEHHVDGAVSFPGE